VVAVSFVRPQAASSWPLLHALLGDQRQNNGARGVEIFRNCDRAWVVDSDIIMVENGQTRAFWTARKSESTEGGGATPAAGRLSWRPHGSRTEACLFSRMIITFRLMRFSCWGVAEAPGCVKPLAFTKTFSMGSASIL